jgi:hypothetical protein
MFKLILIILIALGIVGGYILLTDPVGFAETLANGVKAIFDAIGGLFG